MVDLWETLLLGQTYVELNVENTTEQDNVVKIDWKIFTFGGL